MKKDEKIEMLGDKFLTDLPLETPPVDFSQKVMHRIVQQPLNTSRFAYRPLINKWTWAAIFCLITVVFGYFLVIKDSPLPDTPFSWLDDKMNGISLNLPVIHMPQISETVIFSTLIFGVMALLQISVISRFFDPKSFR